MLRRILFKGAAHAGTATTWWYASSPMPAACSSNTPCSSSRTASPAEPQQPLTRTRGGDAHAHAAGHLGVALSRKDLALRPGKCLSPRQQDACKQRGVRTRSPHLQAAARCLGAAARRCERQRRQRRRQQLICPTSKVAASTQAGKASCIVEPHLLVAAQDSVAATAWPNKTPCHSHLRTCSWRHRMLRMVSERVSAWWISMDAPPG